MSDLVLYDSTLREGSQQAGVNFGLPGSEEITEGLLETGNADFVEIHCYPGTTTERAGKLLERFGSQIVTHHRLYGPDIRNRAALGSGNISMYQTTSLEGLKSLGLDPDSLKEKIKLNLRLAQDMGLTVLKLALEHATTSDPELLKEVGIISRDNGVKTISLPDTKGIATPSEYAGLVSYIQDSVGMPVGAHCHNDLGLAAANALAAYDSGVRWIDSSVLGLGERAGQTPKEVIHTILRVKRGERIPTEALKMIVELVSSLTGVYPSPNHPVAGERAFTQRAGTHYHKIQQLERDDTFNHPYLPFRPEIVGRKESFNLSALSGNSTIRAVLSTYGIKCTNKEVEEIRRQVNSLAEKTGSDVMIRELELIMSIVLKRPLDFFIRRRGESETSTYRIFISTEGRPLIDIVRDIRDKVRGARYIDELYGEKYDIFVSIPRVKPEFGNAYVDAIRSIPGVVGTTTYISARSWK
jgi:isopropylmalate/homocitrate/citramalate synthase